MSDAYIETTVLTDILLKPKTPKHDRAIAAFARYDSTLLPVYSIKEWKAGPLSYFAYVHGKLVQTRSIRNTLQALSVIRGYRQSTAIEALTAAATLAHGLGTTDREHADSYRLALEYLIIRSWRKRRTITTKVVDELPCYSETAPELDKDGLFDLKPKFCDPEQECCLAPQLKSQPELLEALRNAISKTSTRPEDQKRRQALKQLIKHPKIVLDRDTCRNLGDAIFAFCCPETAVILTTNTRDHEPLAQSIGKKAERP